MSVSKRGGRQALTHPSLHQRLQRPWPVRRRPDTRYSKRSTLTREIGGRQAFTHPRLHQRLQPHWVVAWRPHWRRYACVAPCGRPTPPRAAPPTRCGRPAKPSPTGLPVLLRCCLRCRAGLSPPNFRLRYGYKIFNSSFLRPPEGMHMEQ